MLGHLYRYPHPEDATRFIYCGQGANRDQSHRSGATSFGRRFDKTFLGAELPQPIHEEVEVVDREHLNSLETAWMVLYGTWRVFGGMNLTIPGSIDYKNIAVIGGRVSGRKNSETGHIQKIGRNKSRRDMENGTGIFAPGVAARGGCTQGKANIVNGHITRIAGLGGRVSGPLNGCKAVENKSGIFSTKFNRSEIGRKSAESGHLDRIRELPQAKIAQSRVGRAVIARNGLIGRCLRWNVRRDKPCTCGNHKLVAA